MFTTKRFLHIQGVEKVWNRSNISKIKHFREKSENTCTIISRGYFFKGVEGDRPSRGSKAGDPLKNLKWDSLFFIAYSYSLPRGISKTL